MKALIVMCTELLSRRSDWSDASTPSTGRISSGVGRSFEAIVTWLRQRRSRSRAIRELHALPDQLLRDVGIERHEIEAVVCYRRPRWAADRVACSEARVRQVVRPATAANEPAPPAASDDDWHDAA